MFRFHAIAALFLCLVSSVCAETIFQEARFTRNGAEYGGFFSPVTTGSVVLVIPSDPSGSTETLVLSHIPLHGSDPVTTVTVRDPGTTFSQTFEVSGTASGAHYLIARLPESGRIRWTYFVHRDAVNPIPGDIVSSESLAAEYRDLVLRKMEPFFDEETSGSWLANDSEQDQQWMREDIYYAVTLLSRQDPQSLARANATLQAFCSAQERVTTAPFYGRFYSNGHNQRVEDNSVTHFATPILAWLLLNPPAGMTEATRDAMLEALPLAAAALYRYPDHPQYTNYSLNSIAALALAGRYFNDSMLTATAATRMEAHYNHLMTTGAPMEGNSPVYSGVSQWALKLIVADAEDPRTVAFARLLQQRFWLDTALHYHRGVRQSAGPFGRSYMDGVRGATGLTNLMLSIELSMGGFTSPGRVAEMFEANHTLDLNPAYFMTQLPPSLDPELKQVFTDRPLPAFSRQKTFRYDATTYLSQNFALGTMDRSVDLGQNEGFLLHVVEPEAPANWTSMVARTGAGLDDWISPTASRERDTYALQHGSRALVFTSHRLAANSPPARRARFGLVADERLKEWEDLRIDGTPVTLPAEFAPGATLFARRGNAYIAVRALYAEPAGPRQRAGVIARGDGHLTLALHTVDSPTTVAVANSWVNAGFAVYATEQSDWPDYESFISDYLAESVLTVEERPSTRTLSWNWKGSLELEFDRVQRNYLFRKVNGQTLEPVMARSEFAHQSTDGALAVRDFYISGMAPNSWAIYPEGSLSAAVTNTAGTTITATTPWSISPVDLPPYSTVRIPRPSGSTVPDWRRY